MRAREFGAFDNGAGRRRQPKFVDVDREHERLAGRESRERQVERLAAVDAR